MRHRITMHRIVIYWMPTVLPLLVLLLFIGAVVSSMAVRAYAAEDLEDAYDNNQRIFDQAGLLSDSEAEELEKMCNDYGEAAGIDILILTHDDPDAVYVEDYIEDFEDRLPVGDRVYLAVDMQNRDVFIEGHGTAETYIHSKRIQVIIEEITPYLGDGEYYDAFSIYIKDAAAYMEDDSELNYDHDYSAGTPQSSNPDAPYYDETWPSDYNSSTGNPAETILTNVWFQLIVAILIGIVTVSVMAYHSGGKMTAGSSTYMDGGQSGLIGRRDDYIRTQVTRVRRPKENSNNHAGGGFNAGGFRGGVSSGGRSHSSGGGKF